MNDEFWMTQALLEAQKSIEIDEVPVGAVLVRNQEIIGRGYNQVITKKDCSAHAEIEALRDAGQAINNYRLVNTTLYVTLEPCVMCAGSLIHARIERLVFGAFDPKTGSVQTQDNILDKSYHNHSITVQGGVLEQECSALLKQFFKQKRLHKSNKQ